jgi:ABC-2 type transport system permease protein
VTVPALRPYRFVDSVRCEWTKLRTVRSTYWTFLIAVALGVGLGALASTLSAHHYATDPTVRFTWKPATRSLFSLELAQLAFTVLGVITVTSEYSTGMIRTTLTAVPRRSRVMVAKIGVFALAALVVGEAIAFAAFLLGQYLIHLTPGVPTASLHQHNVLRVVVGAGLYLVVIGVLGSALGLLLRHAAAGISVVVAMLFIIPGLVEAALPTSWANPIDEYWPTSAGQRVIFLTTGAHDLSAWWGFADFAGFTVVVVAVALLLLERRDA